MEIKRNHQNNLKDILFKAFKLTLIAKLPKLFDIKGILCICNGSFKEEAKSKVEKWEGASEDMAEHRKDEKS